MHKGHTAKRAASPVAAAPHLATVVASVATQTSVVDTDASESDTEIVSQLDDASPRFSTEPVSTTASSSYSSDTFENAAAAATVSTS